MQRLVDPRVQHVLDDHARETAETVRRLIEQGGGQMAEGSTRAQRWAQQTAPPPGSPLDSTPDMVAADNMPDDWEAQRRRGGVTNTTQQTPSGATAPTPDMVAADGAEDPETRRNRRHNRQILG